MTDVIIGVIGSIICVLIGFLFSEIRNWIHEKSKEKKQSESVRTIISLEIEQNLSLLENFWKKLNNFIKEEKDEDIEDKDSIPTRLAYRFIEMPKLNWNHKFVDSQLSFMSLAFNKDEINKIMNFHSQLDAIAEIQKKLSSIKNKADEKGYTRASQMKSADIVGSLVASYTSNSTFIKKVPELWGECERIILEVSDKGNPLNKKQRNNTYTCWN